MGATSKASSPAGSSSAGKAGMSRRTVLRAGAIGGGMAIAGFPARAARAAAAPGGAGEAGPTIVVGAQAPPLQQLAAREVQRYLWQLTGSVPQLLTDDAVVPTGSGALIPLGTASSNRVIAAMAGAGQLPAPASMPGAEGYVIKTASYSGRPVIAVDGTDDHGVLYGSYRLAEQYGARFYIDRDVLPETPAPFAVQQLDITAAPAQQVRGLLPWYDFLNGPSGYSFADWKRYIDQMLKLGMNTLMLHNYDGGYPGADINEPFMDFTYKGQHPDAWLDTSINNQRWGMAPFHTGDLAFHSGDYFPYDIMGSDAARFTAGQPNTQANIFLKAKAMMQQVIHYAQARGAEVVLGTDFDIVGQPLIAAGCNPLDPSVLQARLDDILTTYPTLKYIQMYFSEANNASTGDAIKAYQFMHDYLAAQRPWARLVTGSWFQEERFPEMDAALPQDVIFSTLMPHEMTVKPQWAQVAKNRTVWPVPWMEFDGGLSEPELAVSRMQQSLPQLAQAGVQGMIGILWRGRAAEANVAYLAKAMWQPAGQAITTDEHYRDYAAHTFGPAVAASGAAAMKALETGGTYPGLGSVPLTTPEYGRWNYGLTQDATYANHYQGIRDQFRALDPQVTTAGGRDSLGFYDQFLNWLTSYWTAQYAVPAAHTAGLPKSNYFLVNAGSNQGEKDLQPDYGFYGATSTFTTGAVVQNDFGYPQAMQSERWSSGTWGYRFTVPQGYDRYRVELYFSENWFGTPYAPGNPVGQRVTNIAIDGTTVQQNFDIAKAAGGSNIGTRLIFDVPAPASGILDIAFIPVVSNPKVDIIRAYPIDASGNPLPEQSQPGNPLKAWEDLKASGFRDAIAGYQQAVRDTPTLGGLLSASGGRWYDGQPSLYKDYERQIVALLPVPPPDNVVVRGTPTGAVITWRPYDGKQGAVTAYNVYRAAAGSQNFTKLNNAPVTGTSYTDTANGSYTYAVTALTADGTESPRSYEEQVQAGASDTQPPQVLLISEPDHAVAHEPVTITATVIDGRAPAHLSATLHYRRIGAGQPWTAVPMAPNTAGRDHTFYADIPASAVNQDSLEYYISASDGASTGYAPPGAPALTSTLSVWPQPAAAPSQVTSVTATPNPTGAGYLVSWPAASGPVHTYAIYRGTSTGFQPDSTTYLTYVPSQQTSFADVSTPSGQPAHYKIVAVTIDERSAPASPASP